MTDFQTARDAQALADATAESMFARDMASRSLGMRILRMAPGYAQLAMAVRPDMLNGHQTCHGGFIFALADSAFAFACNSHNLNTVASACAIDYLAPARESDLLQAEAVEQARAGRTGVYDVTVTNQHGERIALFRGKSHQVKGEVISSTTEQPAAVNPP